MGIITGKTKILGVIGNPIEHSLSPVMHNAAITALGVDYVYLPLPVKPETWKEAIAGLDAIGCVGFNVTIPYKQEIMAFCQEVSTLAQLVGAVNTVTRTSRGWSGDNTDVAGFLAPLQKLTRNWSEINPVILGCGGAARAVVVACSELGCPEIRVVGRSRDKLNLFAQSWTKVGLKTPIAVYHWSELAQILPTTKLLINATPIGMYPQITESPLTTDLVDLVQPGAIAYDLIYTPNPTKFLASLKTREVIVIDGLEMLVQQGAIALEMWLKKSVPLEIMRQSLINFLELS